MSTTILDICPDNLRDIGVNLPLNDLGRFISSCKGIGRRVDTDELWCTYMYNHITRCPRDLLNARFTDRWRERYLGYMWSDLYHIAVDATENAPVCTPNRYISLYGNIRDNGWYHLDFTDNHAFSVYRNGDIHIWSRDGTQPGIDAYRGVEVSQLMCGPSTAFVVNTGGYLRGVGWNNSDKFSMIDTPSRIDRLIGCNDETMIYRGLDGESVTMGTPVHIDTTIRPEQIAFLEDCNMVLDRSGVLYRQEVNAEPIATNVRQIDGRGPDLVYIDDDDDVYIYNGTTRTVRRLEIKGFKAFCRYGDVYIYGYT